MSNPDSTKPRPSRERTPRKRQAGETEFRETLAAPVPNRTYRSEVDLTESRTAVTEQAVRLVTTLLSTLLAIRFLIGLFTTDRNNPVVGFFYAVTDWLVAPFQAILGRPSAATSGLGYFDWPTLAALALTLLVATLLIRFIRQPKV